jgi:hypothetical protein
MTKVFYHNDPDGFCAAYWVRKHLEQEGIPFETSDFIEMNYDKQFPWDVLTPDEQVFMVDFSLNDPEDMIKLSKMSDFIWIDHHKTAIDKMNVFCNKSAWEQPKGIRIDGVAACALTWAFFFGNKDDATYMYDAPLFTQYIHLWDTWAWKNQPEKDDVEAFITAFMSKDINPMSKAWDEFLEEDPDIKDLPAIVIQEGYVQPGHAMISFRDGYGKTCCDSIGKTIEFEGIRCFVCNMAKCNSEWFKSVDPTSYDVLMPFYYNVQTEQFCFSLYSDKVDVSKIAVKYGGGGHCGSAGFQLTELPF